MSWATWRRLLLPTLLLGGLVLATLPNAATANAQAVNAATRASTATAAGPGAPPPGPRLAGVDFLTGYRALTAWAFDFPRIKADGANTISLDVWWRVPSVSSNAVAPDFTRLDNLTPTVTDADLLTVTREARQAGLNVMLTPKIVVGSNVNNSGWRGLYNPPNPATFFANYTAMVDHYASLAQQGGMTMFLVGSEMVASDRYVSNWRQVIASARQRFKGQIGYEVDWREIPQFSWGDAVDDLFLSAYFATSNEERPTLAQLEAGWHSYRAPGETATQDAFSEVASFARRWHKPIVFGEAGYTATLHPAREPWWNAPDSPDPQLQYLAYEALLDTFVGQPWWGGVMWWAWNDSGPRSPENKPAERLIGAQCVAPPPGAPPAQTVGGPCHINLASYGSPSGGVTRLVGGIALGALVLAAAALISLGWLIRPRRLRRGTS